MRWLSYEYFVGMKANARGGLFGARAMIQVNLVDGTDGLMCFVPHRGVTLHRMRNSFDIFQRCRTAPIGKGHGAVRAWCPDLRAMYTFWEV